MTSPVLGPGPVPPPPDPLECGRHELAKGAVVHRIHDARFAAEAFNPGFGLSRFAPFEVAGKKVATAYAATSLECAIFETIFHDVESNAAFKTVSTSTLAPLVYSTLQLTRTVRLAPFFSVDLMKWNIERNQLIDTPRSTYGETRLWSPAAHESAQAPDGMIWVSRRYDQEQAFMLFGSRVAEADWNPLTSVKVSTDATCMTAIQTLAQRAGILLAR